MNSAPGLIKGPFRPPVSKCCSHQPPPQPSLGSREFLTPWEGYKAILMLAWAAPYPSPPPFHPTSALPRHYVFPHTVTLYSPVPHLVCRVLAHPAPHSILQPSVQKSAPGGWGLSSVVERLLGSPATKKKEKKKKKTSKTCIFYICELTFCVVPYHTFLLLYVWNIQHYYQFKIILQGWGTKQAPLGKRLAVQSDKLSLTSKTQVSPFPPQTKWRRKKINITSRDAKHSSSLGAQVRNPSYSSGEDKNVRARRT